MLNELFAIHNEVMSTTPTAFKRYLSDQVNWDNQAVCILGDRGVGKSTMVCQHLLETYPSPKVGLYISADNINILANGLLVTAREYFSGGGEALIIDEVHKYPNWSIEIKNIIDTYKRKKIIILGSSSVDLKKSKGDLSRRVVYYNMPGLSFREYLNFECGLDLPPYSFDEVLENHVEIATSVKDVTVLKYFREYCARGYYPIFVEGVDDYLSRLNNVIEKVIYEDIAIVFNLKQTTLTAMKQILWLIATSESLSPNIDKISKSIKVSREVVYNCFEYLNQSGLVMNMYQDAQGMKLIRKPGKVYLNNTNLLHAINGELRLAASAGIARETIFINQVATQHRVNLHDIADFVVDGKVVVEVGGPNKSNRQLKGNQNGYLALDGIEIGYQHKIPLYLFGFLY